MLQAKGVAKKFQQSTPKGSPPKPQPLQRAGPLEAVKVFVCLTFVHHSLKALCMLHMAGVQTYLGQCAAQDAIFDPN